MLHHALAVAAVVVAASACRIEDRTPTGTRQDEATVRAVITTFYQGRATHDWAAARSVLWDSAIVAVHEPVAGGVWAASSADDYVAAAARSVRGRPPSAGVSLVRTDFRQQGPLATMWVTARSDEYGLRASAADHFLLRRINGAWRIVHYVSVPQRDIAGP